MTDGQKGIYIHSDPSFLWELRPALVYGNILVGYRGNQRCRKASSILKRLAFDLGWEKKEKRPLFTHIGISLNLFSIDQRSSHSIGASIFQRGFFFIISYSFVSLFFFLGGFITLRRGDGKSATEYLGRVFDFRWGVGRVKGRIRGIWAGKGGE